MKFEALAATFSFRQSLTISGNASDLRIEVHQDGRQQLGVFKEISES